MAEDLEGGAEVADDGTDVGPCFKAVVLVWIGPVPWYAMAWVPEFIVDEEFQPAGAGEGGGGVTSCMVSKYVRTARRVPGWAFIHLEGQPMSEWKSRGKAGVAGGEGRGDAWMLSWSLLRRSRSQ